MKLLPCPTCHEPALASRATGVLLSVGRMSGPQLKYKCKRCGHPHTISSAEFLRLPEMAAEEIDADTCDVTRPESSSLASSSPDVPTVAPGAQDPQSDS